MGFHPPLFQVLQIGLSSSFPDGNPNRLELWSHRTLQETTTPPSPGRHEAFIHSFTYFTSRVQYSSEETERGREKHTPIPSPYPSCLDLGHAHPSGLRFKPLVAMRDLTPLTARLWDCLTHHFTPPECLFTPFESESRKVPPRKSTFTFTGKETGPRC